MLKTMDYTRLLEKARELGGPQKLIHRLKAEGFREGRRAGKRSMIPAVLLAAGVGAALAIGAERLCWFLQDCRAEALTEQWENDMAEEPCVEPEPKTEE